MHQGQKQQQQQAAQTSGRPRPPQQGGPGAGAGDKPFQPARQVFNMNAKGVPKPLFKAQEGPKQPPAPKPAKVRGGACVCSTGAGGEAQTPIPLPA